MLYKDKEHILDKQTAEAEKLAGEANKIGAEMTPAEILEAIIHETKPLDFMAMVTPKIEDWKRELKELESVVIKPDGSFNLEAKEETKRYTALQKKVAGAKVTKLDYQIHTVERLQVLANNSDWAFSKRRGSIFLYTSEYWTEIEKETFYHFLGEVAVAMGVPSTYAKHHRFRDDLLAQFLATFYLKINDTDPDSVLINLNNGCLELTPFGQTLREFRKADFLKYKLDYDYDPNAVAPLFQKYLDRVLPSKTVQDVFFESIAYAFTKNSVLKLEKMCILYGQGANGKSLALDVIQRLIGRQNVSNYSLSSLTDSKGYSRAEIQDKILNVASEISGNIENDFFKQLSSGEPVEARKPYSDAFVIHDYARFMFSCNVLPKSIEHSHGFFRRFTIIPFDQTIGKEERDPGLARKIIDGGELSGILNLVLDGLKRLLNNRKFSQCDEIESVGKLFKLESNSVLLWMEENGYLISESVYEVIGELYPKYTRYCKDVGNSPFSRLNFKRELVKSGVLVKRQNVGQVAYLQTDSKLDDEQTLF